MKEDIRQRIKEILVLKKVTVNSISHNKTEQRRLNRQINEDSTITFETISSIVDSFPELDANWLITGKGEMYKTEYTAGRDNNVVQDKNYGVVGSSNTIGSMVAENSGNYVSMGDQKVKKLLKDGEIHIEMEQSAEIELLKQTNSSLLDRIKELEAMVELKDKVYVEMKSSKDQIIEAQKQTIEILSRNK